MLLLLFILRSPGKRDEIGSREWKVNSINESCILNLLELTNEASITLLNMSLAHSGSKQFRGVMAQGEPGVNSYVVNSGIKVV